MKILNKFGRGQNETILAETHYKTFRKFVSKKFVRGYLVTTLLKVQKSKYSS